MLEQMFILCLFAVGACAVFILAAVLVFIFGGKKIRNEMKDEFKWSK